MKSALKQSKIEIGHSGFQENIDTYKCANLSEETCSGKEDN